MSRERCWIKLAPEFAYASSTRQTGWKFLGITRRQPKTGIAICLDLNIPFPQAIPVELDEVDVKVMAESDTINQRIVDELDGKPDMVVLSREDMMQALERANAQGAS